MMLDTWRLTTNSLHPSWCCMLPYTSCNPRNNRLHPSFFSQYCLQNLPQSKIYIEWVSPSSVSCGPNFFIFFTNFKMSHCNRMVLVRPSSCTIVELSPPPTLSLKHLLNQSGLYDSCSGTSEHKLDKLEHLEEHMHLGDHVQENLPKTESSKTTSALTSITNMSIYVFDVSTVPYNSLKYIHSRTQQQGRKSMTIANWSMTELQSVSTLHPIELVSVHLLWKLTVR